MRTEVVLSIEMESAKYQLTSLSSHSCAVASQLAHPRKARRAMQNALLSHHSIARNVCVRLCLLRPLRRLLLVRLATLRDALQDLLPVLVHLQLGDLDLAGRNTDGHALAVGLLTRDALDVDDVLEAVDGGDLALAALVGATLDDNLVVFADGDRADLQ